MKKHLCTALAIAFFGLFFYTLNAQEAKPRRELAEFNVQKGKLLVKGRSDMGSANGIGQVTVEVMLITDVESGERASGLRVEIKTDGNNSRADYVLMDETEVGALAKAIEYLIKVEKSVTPLKQFDVGFTARCGLVVGVFNKPFQGELVAMVTSDRIGGVAVLLPMDQMMKLQTIVGNARAKLDELKK